MGCVKKVVFVYFGGVDILVCIFYLMYEWGVEEVIIFVVDLGQGDELGLIQEKVLWCGVVEFLVIDGKEEFVKEYVFCFIQVNVFYENCYFFFIVLVWFLIVKMLVEVVEKYGVDVVVYGCIGKGND